MDVGSEVFLKRGGQGCIVEGKTNIVVGFAGGDIAEGSIVGVRASSVRIGDEEFLPMVLTTSMESPLSLVWIVDDEFLPTVLPSSMESLPTLVY